MDFRKSGQLKSKFNKGSSSFSGSDSTDSTGSTGSSYSDLIGSGSLSF